VRRFIKTIDSINHWAGKVLSYLLLVTLATIFYEVVARYFFKAPTRWVMEYNGYFLCGYSILAGGYTLLNQAHVNVDILYGTLSYRTKAAIDCFTSLLFFVFVGIVGYLGGEFAYDAFVGKETSGTVLNTPIFPAKAIIPIGSALLLLQGLAKLIKDVETAITGKVPEDMEAGGILGKRKEE
jgi:TRAP-type mannitol/chloroaromatic compound transport system permease small subunit